MRPHVTCHMMSSVDGRIKSANWGLKNPSRLFEDSAATIKVDAWIVGRTTMQEFSSKKPHRKRKGVFSIPRTDFVGDYRTKTFAVAIDPNGKCRWDSNMVDTEHVIEVLTQSVSGEYLDHLRSKNVSYLFGGKDRLNLGLVLEKLGRLFPIRRVRIDGGGNVNGSFLAAGLIDEFSHLIVPAADGTVGSPTVFDVDPPRRGRRANRLRLMSVERMPGSVLWCRYRVARDQRG
jgi:2,5-diamino-6-(ribosylamino)-4(3H)-pyrimidinone 5'-phosphate reductase